MRLGREPGRDVIALAAVLGVIGIFTAVVLALPSGSAMEQRVSDGGVTVAAVAAAAIMAVSMSRRRSKRQRGWVLLTAGVATWAIAEMLWLGLAVAGKEPFPSIADVFYLVAIIPLGAGVAIIAAPPRALARTRLTLDAVAVTFAGAAPIWHFVLLPTYRSANADLVSTLVASAYPVTDMVMVALAAILLMRATKGGHALPLTAFCAGLLAFLLADVGFALQELGDGYRPGLVDAGWFGGYLLIAIAGLRREVIDEALDTPDALEMTSAPRQASVLVAQLAMVPFLIVVGIHGELVTDPMSTLLASCAILMVVVREVVVLSDNVRLNRTLLDLRSRLELRVQERTRELSRLVSIVESTTDLVATANLDGQVTYLNGAGRKFAGLGTKELGSGTTLDHLLASWSADLVLREAMPEAIEHGSWEGETAILGQDGREVPAVQTVLAHRGDGGAVEFVSMIARDISEQKQFENHLSHLANHDALTGLFNRHRFLQELTREAERLARGDEFVLAYIDLDHFKSINDTLGHAAGDELLVAITSLIRNTIEPADILARLGGDEFAVLMPSTSLETARVRLEAIREAVRSHVMLLRGRVVRVTASIGAVRAPADGQDAGHLLAKADMAMYRAKANRDRVCEYSAELDSAEVLDRTRVMEIEIREALEQGRFTLFAQLVAPLARGEERHYEALLRIVQPDGTAVLPPDLFQVAERSSIIHDIDRWVVREAVELIKLASENGEPVTLHTNLSAKAIEDEALPGFIRDTLRELGVDPGRLVLEITETAAVTNMLKAIEFIRAIKRIGCKFALDDFGVGYSSMAHLKNMDIEYLKIDGSFVANMASDRRDEHLVRAMVELARGLGKQTVAEYVGDEETARLLKRMGVDYLQGYYVGTPQPTRDGASALARTEAA